MAASSNSTKYLNLRKFCKLALSDYDWTSYILRQIRKRCDTANDNDPIHNPAVQKILLEGLKEIFQIELEKAIKQRETHPNLVAIDRLEDHYNKKFAIHYHAFKTSQELGKTLTLRQAEFIANVEQNIVNEIRKNIRLFRHEVFHRACRKFKVHPSWSKKYEKACKHANKGLLKEFNRGQLEGDGDEGFFSKIAKLFLAKQSE